MLYIQGVCLDHSNPTDIIRLLDLKESEPVFRGNDLVLLVSILDDANPVLFRHVCRYLSLHGDASVREKLVDIQNKLISIDNSFCIPDLNNGKICTLEVAIICLSETHKLISISNGDDEYKKQIALSVLTKSKKHLDWW
jgi:hypothetical protein